jgi:hypothetical protein
MFSYLGAPIRARPACAARTPHPRRTSGSHRFGRCAAVAVTAALAVGGWRVTGCRTCRRRGGLVARDGPGCHDGDVVDINEWLPRSRSPRDYLDLLTHPGIGQEVLATLAASTYSFVRRAVADHPLADARTLAALRTEVSTGTTAVACWPRSPATPTPTARCCSGSLTKRGRCFSSPTPGRTPPPSRWRNGPSCIPTKYSASPASQVRPAGCGADFGATWRAEPSDRRTEPSKDNGRTFLPVVARHARSR